LYGKPGFFLSPDEHDRVCAIVSHLPHVVANIFTSQVYRAEADLNRLAGPSFRDYTRIAGSSPTIWLDIFLTNRDQIVKAIEDLDDELRWFKELLIREDEVGLLAFLNEVKKLKERVDNHDSL
jgi:prephenate dehydrogenase